MRKAGLFRGQAQSADDAARAKAPRRKARGHGHHRRPHGYRRDRRHRKRNGHRARALRRDDARNHEQLSLSPHVCFERRRRYSGLNIASLKKPPPVTIVSDRKGEVIFYEQQQQRQPRERAGGQERAGQHEI